MSTATTSSNAGTEAVKELRLNKLRQGLPFMINSRELPGKQCYLEYPNGTITLVELSSATKEFVILKELTSSEGLSLRKKFNLVSLNA